MSSDLSTPSLSPASILYEDNHCLVINKPARLLTVGDSTQDPNLLDLAKDYLKQKFQKPGDVFLGVVHRLDRPVSGVVLFARTSKAASRLADQFRTRTLDKVYWALVTGTVAPNSGTLENWLLKDSQENFTTVVPPNTSGAKACVLSYRILSQGGAFTLLEIQPQTGRSHQIRVQLATQGWPIAGDRKYGSAVSGQGAIGLHAVELSFEHPTLRQTISVQAPVPEAWNEWSPSVTSR